MALACLLVLVGLASSCAPPPPVCRPEERQAQKDAFIRNGGEWNAQVEWLAAWLWSDPANCRLPDSGPPPVVPEAPAAILLPAGALVVGGGALFWTRRRRSAPTRRPSGRPCR